MQDEWVVDVGDSGAKVLTAGQSPLGSIIPRFAALPKSQRQIAKELHHSRHTVAAAFADPGAGSYQLREPRPAPVLAPYQAIIEQWLREDLTAPPKQHRTAHRIFTQLVEPHQFPGAESTIRRFVRQLRLNSTLYFAQARRDSRRR